MKLKTKINSYLFLFICSFSFGQIGEYTYKRELEGIKDKWHTIELPNEIFSKISPDFSDLRIYGITTQNDTIEAPYLLNISKGKTIINEIIFKSINNSFNENGYYFTFKIPAKESINQIKLDFKRDNFDWKIALQGSQNQQEWFQILDNYRILSIKNEQTNYQFTNINFPNSKYLYYRLRINSKKKPLLDNTLISFEEFSGVKLKNFAIKKVTVNESKSTKETVIDVDLKNTVPISIIKLNMADTYDYYRPITIKYLTDSVKTEQGWYYNYSILSSSTISSIEESKFRFNSTVLQKLKIIIHNYDNEPLSFKDLEVKGYSHSLISRFTKPAIYFLTYGNNKIGRPNYDLNHLTSNIPDSLTMLTMKGVKIINKKEAAITDPLFKNKTWLWALMVVIILVLGGFTLKMMQKK